MYKAIKKIKADINGHKIECKVGAELDLSDYEAQVLARSGSVEKIESAVEVAEVVEPVVKKKRGRKKKDS